MVDKQEDLELSEVNIEDDVETSRASRFQSQRSSVVGRASVSSSVAFDVSLRVAAELALLEPGHGQRDARIDEVDSLIRHLLIVQFFLHRCQHSQSLNTLAACNHLEGHSRSWEITWFNRGHTN